MGIESIQKLLDDLKSDPTADDPIVIEYTDGTSQSICSHREMLEEALALEIYADKILEELKMEIYEEEVEE